MQEFREYLGTAVKQSAEKHSGTVLGSQFAPPHKEPVFAVTSDGLFFMRVDIRHLQATRRLPAACCSCIMTG